MHAAMLQVASLKLNHKLQNAPNCSGSSVESGFEKEERDANKFCALLDNAMRPLRLRRF